MVKDVVLASDAVAVAPIAFIAEEVALRKLVPLRARAAWMQTGYGFVSLRGITPSPAAEAFKQAVRRVEDEAIATEKQVNSGGAA